MREAWRVFTRDVMRLVRVRKAWIILLGIVITPSLYAWFNIAAFWDPYTNTQNIDVAVVNLDEGASSVLAGKLDVGDEVVDQLKENDELGWRFLDEDEAMESVESGESYAAIIIPENFSQGFASFTTGSFTKPSLQYYVNEKASAVAPKITDVGASTLDTQIGSTFISTVAETVTDKLKDVGADAEGELRGVHSDTIGALDRTLDAVSSGRARIGDLQGSLSEAQDRLRGAQGTIDKADGTFGDVQSALAQAQSIVEEAQQELVTITGSVTDAYVSGTTLLGDATSRLNTTVSRISAGADRAGIGATSAIDTAEALLGAGDRALTDIESFLNSPGGGSAASQQLGSAVTGLQERTGADRTLLDQLRQLSTGIGGVTDQVEQAFATFDAGAGDASSSADALRDSLRQVVPALNGSISSLSSSAGGFASALGAPRAQLTQAKNLLTGLDDQLGQTSSALGALDGNLAGTEDAIEGVRSDVLALGTADAWDQLHSLTGLDEQAIGDFLGSPVQVDEHDVFPVANYGSSMAPLFTNLALWIGAFVLVVIFRLEVDTEGLRAVTARQAYFGRWLLLAMFGAVQAVVVNVGNLLIGVQTASSTFVFLGTGVFIGLAYLSIIYALSVSFGYLGKGLAVFLVIMQIPGASGLYPIEMMPGFFRTLYTFFPFTYGIDAMRETIAGVYDGRYWRSLGILALFVVLAFALGLLLRPRLGNFARLFNQKVAQAGLFVSEDVQIASGRHRLTQLIDALVSRDEFRNDVLRRERRFTRRYPTLLRATVAAGVAALVLVGIIGWLTPIGKATVLGLWILCGLLVIGFLLVLEYTRRSIELATEVGRMSEAELRETLAHERALAETLIPASGGSGVPAAAQPTFEDTMAEETTDEIPIIDEGGGRSAQGEPIDLPGPAGGIPESDGEPEVDGFEDDTGPDPGPGHDPDPGHGPDQADGNDDERGERG